MRIDQSNWGEFFRACPTIMVDGALVEHVIEADDAIGYVDVYPYDDNGMPKLNDTGTGFATHRIYGAVKIVGARQPWARSKAIPSRLMRF